MTAASMVDELGDKIAWYESEIERLQAVIREQDRRAKTTTARGEIRVGNGGPTFIVTCPSGDEGRLMRLVFCGFALHAFMAFQTSAETQFPGIDIRRDTDVLFDRTPEEVSP